MHIIQPSDISHLFTALRGQGYAVVAPTLHDGTIVLDMVSSVDQLPRGVTDVQNPAEYGTARRTDEALFGYAVGPHSWKKFLLPPVTEIFALTKVGKGFDVARTNGSPPQKYAFVGVRPCELSAIGLHDRVFCDGPYVHQSYSEARRETFIAVVNCAEPRGTCFCVSMNTGPKASGSYDLAMTEVLADGVHQFIVQAGSERGEGVLKEIPHRPAEQAEIDRGEALLASAATKMGRSLAVDSLPQILLDNFEHPQWDDIARRCLGCGNCTMVCPTCFCLTLNDVTDLKGDHAERWRRWDSCFTADFTRIAGGNIRMSTRTRYRQWLMHKLSHWVEQFGAFGCVGCGRCITWCPVGIDITEEARTIRETSMTANVG